MVRKNPFGTSLGSVLRAAPGTATAETGRRVFQDALPGHQDPPPPPDLAAERLEKRARTWVEAWVTAVDYLPGPLTRGQLVTLQLFWHDVRPHVAGEESLRLPAVPLAPGERLPGLATLSQHVDAKSPPALRDFFLGRFAALAATLRSGWACADAWERMGYGSSRDPRREAHWATFLGPQHAALAERLAAAGAGLERRREGFLLRAWENPFAPDKKRADALGAILAAEGENL